MTSFSPDLGAVPKSSTQARYEETTYTSSASTSPRPHSQATGSISSPIPPTVQQEKTNQTYFTETPQPTEENRGRINGVPFLAPSVQKRSLLLSYSNGAWQVLECNKPMAQLFMPLLKHLHLDPSLQGATLEQLFSPYTVCRLQKLLTRVVESRLPCVEHTLYLQAPPRRCTMQLSPSQTCGDPNGQVLLTITSPPPTVLEKELSLSSDTTLDNSSNPTFPGNNLLSKIATSLTSTGLMGDHSHQHLLQSLGQICHADIAFSLQIAPQSPSGSHSSPSSPVPPLLPAKEYKPFKLLSFWQQDTLTENPPPVFRHDAWMESILAEAITVQLQDAQLLWPHCFLLKALGIQAFATAWILDEEGLPIGIVGVLSRKPFSQPPLVQIPTSPTSEDTSTPIPITRKTPTVPPPSNSGSSTQFYRLILSLYAKQISLILQFKQLDIHRQNQAIFIKSMLKNVSQMVFWKDRELRYQGCNQALAEMAGFSHPEELIGLTDYDMPWTPEEIEKYRADDRTVLYTKAPLKNIQESQHQSNGKNSWRTVDKFPIRDATGEVMGVLGIINDITERKYFSEKVGFLNTLSRDVGNAEDFPTALAIVLERVCDQSGWDYGEVWAPSQDESVLLPLPICHSSKQRLQGFRQLSESLVFYRGDGLPGQVWESGKAQLLEGSAQLKEHLIFRAQAAENLGLQGGVGVPIIADDRVLAVLVFFSFTRQDSDESSFDLVQSVAQQLNTIMQRLQVEDALRAAEKRYRSIFENAVEGIFQSTLNGRYTIANPMMAEIYGYDSPDDLIASIYNIGEQVYVESNRRETFIDLMNRNGEVRNFESAVYRQDSSIIWISESARVIQDAQGEVVGYEGTVVDITERHRARKTIEFMAYYDPLTGLANRVLFDDRLRVALALAERNSQRLAVIFLDVDRFKTINDTLGHDIGDLLLKGVADRLKNCLRESDTVARWGGDEFTILLPEVTGAKEVREVANRILETMGPAFDCDSHPLHITVSLGVALYPTSGTQVQTLLKNADTALYRAKEKGRNTFELYTPSMNAQASKRLALENQLQKAIKENELRLFYQPQYELNSGKIVGAEVLLRWQHPELGLLGPGAFLALAEENGLIVPIGEWVLETAAAKVVQWKKAGIPQLPRLSINLSAKQFQRPNFLNVVQDILLDNQLELGFLELEITENIAMQDAEHTAMLLRQLREMGVWIAIDDFGTGYSSMGYLHHFPFNTLKIDRAFVKDIGLTPSATAVAKALLALGEGLGLNIVAEGVETQQQLDTLKQLGCNVAQGYFLARPMPEAELLDLLKTAAIATREDIDATIAKLG